ncbi:MAG TPA: hypothetical protein ENK66_04260 [Arcobacter sp.]|jgi:hypothetical protein|nr:hypothetical protein [Arcobacter sp.]
MKKTLITGALLTSVLLFTGCDNNTSDNETHEHGDDTRVVVFYNATENYHYGYDVAEEQLINLNETSYSHDGEDVNITNFNLTASEIGKPFIWLDNKGDTNESNDEQKLIMTKSTYNYATDGNITWEDFYYLGHFHSEEENGETHYHLAAHSNDEFDTTAVKKVAALKRINIYLSAQNQLEQNLTNTIPSGANGLCGFYTKIDHEHEEKTHFAMGNNGTIYIYDENITALQDEVVVHTSCTAGEMGISGVEEGVWVYLADSQKVHVVDSHDDGVYHVHETHNVSEYVGDGKSIKTMVSIEPVSSDDH